MGKLHTVEINQMWAKNHKIKIARWHKLYYQRWRESGACTRCGEPTSINEKTGKPYARCFKHRVMAAKVEQNHYKRKHNECRRDSRTTS